MAWFGNSHRNDALDRLEELAQNLELDLRKVVIELSAAAETQKVAAMNLEKAANARIHPEGEDSYALS